MMVVVCMYQRIIAMFTISGDGGGVVLTRAPTKYIDDPYNARTNDMPIFRRPRLLFITLVQN